jgi:hypothetical protein
MMEHTEIVRNEAEAMEYARKMHATLGPLMSRQQAHDLVMQTLCKGGPDAALC